MTECLAGYFTWYFGRQGEGVYASVWLHVVREDGVNGLVPLDGGQPLKAGGHNLHSEVGSSPR